MGAGPFDVAVVTPMEGGNHGRAPGAVAGNREGSRFLVWLFNIVGTADLLLAITLATIYGAPDFLGAAYWIPAFWVPALLVSHYIVFAVMLDERRAQMREAFRRRIDVSGAPRAPRAGAA